MPVRRRRTRARSGGFGGEKRWRTFETPGLCGGVQDPDLLTLAAVGPLEAPVSVGRLGHPASDATLCEFGLDGLTDDRVLVGILDVRLQHLLFSTPAAAEEAMPRRMQGQVARGSRPSVEVLMPPAVGRHEGAALMPGDECFLLSI